jgi:CPA2 family monovalent cation:H+ antiporter-2
MAHDPLTQVLLLLMASVLVVTLARRIGLPPVLGYLIVGVLVGPHTFGLLADSEQTHLLAEIGVVFLLFTLGLEFSWPRMVAMRREVFGLGMLQVVGTMSLFMVVGHLLGLPWLVSLVVGGAVSMSSTAIVIRQLTEQAEINRTHGRLTFAILLFQDLAFVPLLAMATALSVGAPTHLDFAAVVKTVAIGFLALLVVLLSVRCSWKSPTAG